MEFKKMNIMPENKKVERIERKKLFNKKEIVHFIIKQHFMCIVNSEKGSHIYFYCLILFSTFSHLFCVLNFAFFFVKTYNFLYAKEQYFLNCKQTHTQVILFHFMLRFCFNFVVLCTSY